MKSHGFIGAGSLVDLPKMRSARTVEGLHLPVWVRRGLVRRVRHVIDEDEPAAPWRGVAGSDT